MEQRMSLTHSLLGIVNALVSSAPAWAAGSQITALTEPIGNWVVTVQWIVGVVGTIILMVSALIAWRSEAIGIIGIIFGIICIAIAIKAPDIVASFGPQRAVAATLMPVVITAGQQVLDGVMTWLVNTAWILVAVWQVRHARRTARI
jgi:hypothetical protein